MAVAENVLPIDFLQDELNEKWLITKICRYVCALLNSNGGKLVLTATNATPQMFDASGIIRKIEQHFQQIVDTFEIHNNFNILNHEYNTITLGITPLPMLCTLNTNMYLPTNAQILMISAKDHDSIKHVLFERRKAEISKQNFSEFVLGCDCGFRESKTVQFKCLKTAKTKHKDFVKRMESNKFITYVSGFANASGGQIFYGINDQGIVEGQSFSDKGEVDMISTKVEQLIQNMTWPKHLSKIERGKQWDVEYIPVKHTDNEATFVIVIIVFPCFGGVFTEDPESYYIIEDNEVKKMNFDIWRSRMGVENALQLQLKRSHWSSKNSEKKYMKLTQRLENFRQLGRWKEIENLVKKLPQRKNVTVNIELVLLFQTIAVHYRQHDFEKAEKYLKEYREKMDRAEDTAIFEVEERYSASALQRSRGDYQNAWKEIEDGLQLAHKAPAGFVIASFYLNAAYILSNLVHDKSFIGVDKSQEVFETRVQEHVNYAKQLCHMALQHLQYVDDEFEIAKEELKQRISITLAFLYLRSFFSSGPCLDTDSASISDSDLKVVEDKISESEGSLTKLSKATGRLDYNCCRLLLVKSDLYFRYYQRNSKISIRIKQLDDSLEEAQKALEQAKCKNFEEIKEYCSVRVENINDIKKQLKTEPENNNDELNENFVEELLNDIEVK